MNDNHLKATPSSDFVTCEFHCQDYLSLRSEKVLALKELESLININIDNINIDNINIDKTQLVFNINLKYINKLFRLTFWKKVIVHESDSSSIIVPHQIYYEKTVPLLTKSAKEELPIDIIQSLEHITLGRKKQSRYLMHSMHPYKGKFHPQIIKSIINVCKINENHLVLDPFCGCGTTNFECSLLGINNIAVDYNPLACFITKTRLNSLLIQPSLLKNELELFLPQLRASFKTISKQNNTLDRFIEDQNMDLLAPLPIIPNIDKWFNKINLQKLLLLKKLISNISEEHIRDLFLLNLSSIIKESSNWDPNQIRPYLLKGNKNNVNIYSMFENNMWKSYKIIKVISLFRDQFNIQPSTTEIHCTDSRDMSFINNDTIDLIITSPPYANALPYLETDRLRSILIGLFTWDELKKIRRNEIGNREIKPEERFILEQEFNSKEDLAFLSEDSNKLINKIYLKNKQLPNSAFRRKNRASIVYKYLKDMNTCVEEMSRILKHAGKCVVIIGNNTVRAGETWMTVNTIDYIKQIAINNNLKYHYEIKKELVNTSHPKKIMDESIIFFGK